MLECDTTAWAAISKQDTIVSNRKKGSLNNSSLNKISNKLISGMLAVNTRDKRFKLPLVMLLTFR
jgi:hypothetical protein